MPSSSDYILAKKIVAIKKDLINSSVGDNNCYYNCNSTVIGDDYDCRQTVSGDRYLTIFSETIHKYVISTGTIGIQLEPGLAYTHGQNIVCVSNTSIPPYDSFKGSVMSYNADTGIIVINKIHDISEGFIYSTNRSYKLNIDNNSENLNISMDNQTDTPCYPNFLPESQGQFTNPRTSQYMTFTPTNGELSVNNMYETTNTITRKNIQDLDTQYAVDFIKQLKPKKYTYLKQENVTRFGLLSEDIPKTFQNDQLGVSNNKNGVAYSEIIAPIISSINMIFEKLDNLETRFTQMEDTVKTMQNTITSSAVATMVASLPSIAESLTDVDESLLAADEPLPDVDEPLLTADEPLPDVDEPLLTADEPLPAIYESVPDVDEPLPVVVEPLPVVDDDEMPINEDVLIEEDNMDEMIEVDNVMDLVHFIAEAKKKYNK